MESSFLPKYEPKIVKISALSVAQHRAEILTIFCSYFERKAKSCELYKDIWENFKMTFLPLFQTPNILQDIEIYHGLRLLCHTKVQTAVILRKMRVRFLMSTLKVSKFQNESCFSQNMKEIL